MNRFASRGRPLDSRAGGDADARRPPRRGNGFTLIEMLIALALAALLVALATPDWRSQRARSELRDRANALVEVMGVARSEAVKRGRRVDVCPGGGASECVEGAAWEAGWLTVIDNDAAPPAQATVLRREGPARPGITIRTSRPLAEYVSFTSLGHARRHDGALQMGTFTVCLSGQDAVKVVLANSGRARVEITRETCP